jgi:hypothetical protein
MALRRGSFNLGVLAATWPAPVIPAGAQPVTPHPAAPVIETPSSPDGRVVATLTAGVEIRYAFTVSASFPLVFGLTGGLNYRRQVADMQAPGTVRLDRAPGGGAVVRLRRK